MDIAVKPGDRLWLRKQIDDLPVGATVSVWRDMHYLYTKGEDGSWYAGGAHTPVAQVRGRQAAQMRLDTNPGYYALYRLPGEEEEPQTLTQYQWSFRDTIMSATEAHGSGRGEVTEAIRVLHLELNHFPFGTGLRIESRADVDTLPDGSMVRDGHPDQWDGYGLFLRKNQAWVRLLGGGGMLMHGPRDGYNSQYHVMTVGGEEIIPDWMTAQPGEGDQEAINEFKANAWRIASRAKHAHGWCGVLENTMARVDVSPNSLMNSRYNGYGLGSHVPVDMVKDLPVGTILRWRHSDAPTTRWSWHARVANATNLAGTILLFGQRDDDKPLRSSQKLMQVLAIPLAGHDRYALRLDPWNERRQLLPPGTIFHEEGGGTRYIAAHDGRVAQAGRDQDVEDGVIPATGDYAWTDFTGANWRISRFHGVPTQLVVPPPAPQVQVPAADGQIQVVPNAVPQIQVQVNAANMAQVAF